MKVKAFWLKRNRNQFKPAQRKKGSSRNIRDCFAGIHEQEMKSN